MNKMKSKYLKLDNHWTLIHQSVAAEKTGLTRDIFEKYFTPVIPAIVLGGSTYYSSFDIDWRIKQLRTESLLNRYNCKCNLKII